MRLVAKHAQVGYQTPGDRPGCRNCKHFDQVRHDSPVIASRQACTLHNIEVTSGGICNSHQAKRQAGESQLAFLSRQRDLLEQQLQEPSKPQRLFGIPQVGEMHEGKPMTKAKHSRLICEQLIANEEASGDPELLASAAFRRRAAGMEPRV